MAYPMIALTTAGTSFACASISLTETGLAVLDDNGSRIGFVPYDSLEYVAPTEEARVTDAPIQVLVEDGSTFGAASLSQTGAGVAVQDHSGSRIGFVPYDTLTYALPESKTGPTLPADATPPEGIEIDEEDDGGSPVWEGDRERSDEHGEDAEDGEEDAERTGDEQAADDEGGVWDDDPAEESDRAESDGERKEGSTGEEPADEGGDDQPEAEDEEVLPCGCRVECTCGASEDAPEEPESESGDGEAGDAEESESEPDGSGGESPESEDREEAEESELVVEWSFGENA